MVDTIKTRTCNWCKTDISLKAAQARYCSRKCYFAELIDSRHEPKVEKMCLQCGNTYMPKTRRKEQKFCCYGCMYDFNLSKNKPILKIRNCGLCGLKYMPARAFQIYCSTLCKARHHRQAWELGVSSNELRNLPEKMSEEEMQEGIAALKPPPGFTTEKPTSRIEFPDIIRDDTPDEEKAPCIRCNSRKAQTAVDLYCLECEKQIEQEKIYQAKINAGGVR